MKKGAFTLKACQEPTLEPVVPRFPDTRIISPSGGNYKGIANFSFLMNSAK